MNYQLNLINEKIDKIIDLQEKVVSDFEKLLSNCEIDDLESIDYSEAQKSTLEMG